MCPAKERGEYPFIPIKILPSNIRFLDESIVRGFDSEHNVLESLLSCAPDGKQLLPAVTMALPSNRSTLLDNSGVDIVAKVSRKVGDDAISNGMIAYIQVKSSWEEITHCIYEARRRAKKAKRALGRNYETRKIICINGRCRSEILICSDFLIGLLRMDNAEIDLEDPRTMEFINYSAHPNVAVLTRERLVSMLNDQGPEDNRYIHPTIHGIVVTFPKYTIDMDALTKNRQPSGKRL